MDATVRSGLVGQLVQHLPAPLLKALDAWSYRIARRRAEQRQQNWLRGKAAATRPEAIPYRLKPWRD